jgi:anti-anti-sigma factor
MSEPTLSVDWFRVAVTTLDTTATIEPEGEWDLAGQPAACRAVAKTLERRPERLVLDLRRLTFMNASGIHTAVDLWKRSHAESFLFAIVPGPRAVQRVFDICRLTETLPFTASP